MEFLELAKKRYSVRSYKDIPVEKEKLDKILEAGRVAPTGVNAQPQRIIAVTSKEGMEKIAKGAKTFGAPVALIICSDKDKAWVRSTDGKNIAEMDASIVSTHMMLQATEIGLGTLWMCWFKPDVIRAEFDISENLEITNLLLIGYADGEAQSADRHDKMRKPISETVKYV